MTSQFDDEELLSLQSPSSRKPAVRQYQQPQPQRNPKPRTSSDLAAGDGRTGQRIGQYDIKKTLGEGSFGKVKLAVHRVSGQEVALKIISRKKLVSRDMAGRVEREISYLQLLRHPHIIKLYTVIMTPSEIIMVLEYAGGELFDYLVKYGKLAEDMARRFFQQIVCSVEYCHRHKIVHRDLKPENLLLDKRLNVKIADFGLSNIMTDGNFLKTSCGSPNYAAPEVISGKLYAGPEVDVWSCGVILYVLLVGKLPFDDEFIPALFRKINSGNYHCPSWMSSGPRNLIAKMLKTNPVQRITIQEIRQDPWFNEGLEDYLKLSVEEFMDTGIDPNKPIDPNSLAPGKPPEVQEAIYNQVVGKLGKTMGYAKGDVQEALQKDEPNAIKDAYLIVRENQIMQSIPTLVTNENVQPFLATSPPAWDANMPGSPMSPRQHAPITDSILAPPRPPGSAGRKPSVSRNEEAPSASPAEKQDVYTSKISILASSLPHYHNMFLEQQRKDKERRLHLAHQNNQEGDGSEPRDISKTGYLAVSDASQIERSPEEQEQLARALKPHSRSTINLQQIIATPIQADKDGSKTEKKRNPKWQFGIRSRNLPHEAMHCVYKALIALGAEWEVPEPVEYKPQGNHHPRSYPVNIKGGTRLDHSMDQSRAGSPEMHRSAASLEQSHGGQFRHGLTGSHHDNNDDDAAAGNRSKRLVPKPGGDGYETDDADIDPSVAPDDYVPADPWCIRVRWRKDGMYPPSTTVHPSSTHSSRADLASAANGETSTATADVPPMTTTTGANLPSQSSSPPAAAAATIGSTGGSRPAPPHGPSPDGSCFVYMDVQLYSIEPGPDRQQVYLVDFKCAGYETLVERAVSESEKVLVGSGYRVKEKDVTSPQPFLDLSNRLVIQLASGNAG